MPLREGAVSLAIALGLAAAAPAAAANEPTKQECVAANESAQDLQRTGKLRDAREQLVMCMASGCPRAVREDCADRLRAVDDATPTVVFVPRGAAGVDVSSASVVLDGALPAIPLDGTAIPVDPGQHAFTFTVIGRPPVVLRLSLREGERLRRDVAFESAVSLEASEHPSFGRSSAIRLVGWSALGAGFAGVTLGAIFGVLAVSKKSSLEDACHERACPATAEYDIDALHFDAVAANISLAIGVLGVGAGAVLLLVFPDERASADSHERTAPLRVRAWVGFAAVGMTGRFR
jgi:hypothetical protein